ncbi:MAG: translation elongation factor Ts [Kiritimatiellae bacterium]|nr:translation elongation factor Ts [Kiritimatiellia bacterium]
MAEITASLVKELREETNVGMMECKRALVETNGDKDQAIKMLRERGVAIAGKKAGRIAEEGVVAAEVFGGGSQGVMIEVNCETDFVARNETFQAFVAELVQKAKTVDGALADAVQGEVVTRIAEIGENLIVRRSVRYDIEDGNGTIASYIHLGGKVGVLVDVGCEKSETGDQEVFRQVVKDLTLHIAASNPQYLSRDEVPEKMISAEREIYTNQVQGKPENIIDKIVSGKLEKFYSQICLLEQSFVKDPEQTVSELLSATSKELDDTLTLCRYTRYQIGG